MTSIAVEAAVGAEERVLEGKQEEKQDESEDEGGVGPLSVLSSGDPSYVLRYCKEFWDGKQVWFVLRFRLVMKKARGVVWLL